MKVSYRKNKLKDHFYEAIVLRRALIYYFFLNIAWITDVQKNVADTSSALKLNLTVDDKDENALQLKAIFEKLFPLCSTNILLPSLKIFFSEKRY